MASAPGASGPPYAASGPPYAASGPPYAASGPRYAAFGPPPATDVEVASALPFLLLGPLAQIGYLPALAPALEPVGLQAQTAAFAAALAYTALGPLERGWRRHPDDLAAAAAFAGLGAPVPGQALTEFARVASSALPALDAVVTRALAEGHTPGEPLILAGAQGGMLLLDREGLFPLAWADTVAGLLLAWRMCGSPPVLVAPTALGALRGLTAAGAIFVVATPPGRGERWRRLPPHRLWTNGDDPALARIAAGSSRPRAWPPTSCGRWPPSAPRSRWPPARRWAAACCSPLASHSARWPGRCGGNASPPTRCWPWNASPTSAPGSVSSRTGSGSGCRWVPVTPTCPRTACSPTCPACPGSAAASWSSREGEMPNPLAIRHLLIRLRPVNRALRAAVERQAAVAAKLDRPDLVPYCVTDEQVAVLLDQLDVLPWPDGIPPALLTPEEEAAEQKLREEAAVAGLTLPLDELASRLGLTGDEQQALVLCAAPELDRAYERVIAYILDDLNRRFPCVELFTAVTAGSGLGGVAQRSLLGRTSRLRLLGLLTPYGEAPTDLRQELRVPPGAVDYLLGNGGDLAILAHDGGAVPIPETVAIPPQVDGAHLGRLGKALRTGDLDLVRDLGLAACRPI